MREKFEINNKVEEIV